MFTSEKRAKLAARSLEKFLMKLGIELKHGQALNALAAAGGYSHWGAMRQRIEASSAGVPEAPAVTPRALRLPSVDGGYYDRFVLVPPDMDYLEARTFANQVIAAVNFEDHERDECLDGEPVEDNIRRRLEARGYVWPNVDTTPDCWDEYNERSLAEPENWQEVRAHFGLPADLELRNEEKHIYAWKYQGREAPSAVGAHAGPDGVQHVWRATLYLDGQSVVGETRVLLAPDKARVRAAMLDEYWDARLEGSEACPTLHVEQLDDGSLTGPYLVWGDGQIAGQFGDLVDAVARADAIFREGCEAASVSKDDSEDEPVVIFSKGLGLLGG